MFTPEQIKSHIDSLRAAMSVAGVDAAIIPQADPHMSEYLASHWQARRWFSGFTGSAGDLVVTADKALLWTDSRYFLQAADQLAGTDIELMKSGMPETPSIEQYLSATLALGSTVGVDGMLMSIKAADTLRNTLEANSLKLNDKFDPVDSIWKERPALPDHKITIHDETLAGESAKDKIARILAEVDSMGASSMLISALDDIAWILNIRSRDVKYNPVATSFLYLAPEGRSVLFVDSAKLDAEITAYLADCGVSVLAYGALNDFIAQLPTDERVLVDPNRTAHGIYAALGSRAVIGTSPIAKAKACKNPVEIAGFKAAMVRDGVALVYAMMEIERRVAADDGITEMDVAEILRRHRSQQALFADESFGTIAGYGAHGAIVHYEANAETNVTLHPTGLLLIDSGAQYHDGTTDITRTIALGKPTDTERRDFTLVMKGHIALASAVWPEGINGGQLDVLAREPLWREGLAYYHGTGHGIGHFLNVHEGPQRIGLDRGEFPILEGMVTSNEPGLYITGTHGIRCENLVLCVERMVTDFGRFLAFETITLFPFDLTLFDTAIMSDEEIEWVNEYHTKVYESLSPLLDEDANAWLKEKTKTLYR